MKGTKLGKKGKGQAETFTVDGITDTLQGWAKRLGTNYHCLYKRIVLRGIDPVVAIHQGGQHQNRNFITAGGETHYINEWARITGVTEKMIHSRLRRGWPIEEALGLVKHENKDESTITWRGKTKSQAEWAKWIGLNINLFYGRVREWRKGNIPKKDLFRKGTGQSGRNHFSQMLYYKGKRYTMKDLAKIKGVSHTWFLEKLHQGISVWDIMQYENKLTKDEMIERNREAQLRHNRLRDLRKIGVIV